mgnify:CR=1 FL=1
MKRWALAKELRTLARDWSPLPITSSTNQGLLNNFLGEVDREALAERIRGKDQPSLRWSLRGTEVRAPPLTDFRAQCRDAGLLVALVSTHHEGGTRHPVRLGVRASRSADPSPPGRPRGGARACRAALRGVIQDNILLNRMDMLQVLAQQVREQRVCQVAKVAE